jgi:hypothetical protein
MAGGLEARASRQKHFDPRHSQDAGQLLVVSAQRAAQRILDPGQKFSLNADPVCG